MTATQHGSTAYTEYGCRCPKCKRAKADEQSALRSKRIAERVDDVHPDAPHGTTGGFVNWCCRCTPCVQAERAYRKRSRDEHFAERVLIEGRLVHLRATHGTRGAYMWFGCRCTNCVATENDYQAARRERKRRANA